MNVVLVEPEATGHHMVLYMRLIVREAVARGWAVHILTTERAARDPAFQTVLAEGCGRLDVALMKDVGRPDTGSITSLIRYQVRSHRAIAAAFRVLQSEVRVDRVFMVNADYIWKYAAIRGSPFGDVPFSCIVMGVAFHRAALSLGPASRMDRINSRLLRRFLALPTLRTAVTVDEAFATFVSGDPGFRKFTYVPDVGELVGEETREEARSALGLDDEDFVVLTYGQLSERKGIRCILEAVAQAPPHRRLLVLVAGRADADVRNILEQPHMQEVVERGLVRLFPGFQADAEEYRLFRSADAVWLGYIDFFGSSGVMLQAASVGVPVLASAHGLIGWTARTHNIGVLVEPRDHQSVTDGISALMCDPALRREMAINARQLAAMHTGSAFGSAIIQTIEGTHPAHANSE